MGSPGMDKSTTKNKKNKLCPFQKHSLKTVNHLIIFRWLKTYHLSRQEIEVYGWNLNLHHSLCMSYPTFFQQLKFFGWTRQWSSMQVVATIKIKVVCICCVLLVYLNNKQGDQPIPAQSAQQNITMGQKARVS